MKKSVKKGQEWWFQLVEGYRLLGNRAEYKTKLESNQRTESEEWKRLKTYFG